MVKADFVDVSCARFSCGKFGSRVYKNGEPCAPKGNLSRLRAVTLGISAISHLSADLYGRCVLRNGVQASMVGVLAGVL